MTYSGSATTPSSDLLEAIAGAHVGDILSISSGILVQGCNSLGAMGAGLAQGIAQKYPDVPRGYRSVFRSTGLHLGQVVWSPPTADRPFWIANAITQDRIGRKLGERYANLDAVAEAFRTVVAQAQEKNLTVHYPLIGAGLGGLPWPEVHACLSPLWGDVPHQLWIHPANPWASWVGRAAAVSSASSPPEPSLPPSSPGFTGRWKRAPR